MVVLVAITNIRVYCRLFSTISCFSILFSTFLSEFDSNQEEPNVAVPPLTTRSWLQKAEILH